MFKYLRTENCSTHPTEIVSLFFEAGDEAYHEIPEGTVFSTITGELEDQYNPSTAIFLALTGKKRNEAAYVKCLPILPNMIFEASISKGEDINFFVNGAVCDVLPDENGKGSSVTTNEGAEFVIIDDSSRGKGFVTIRKL